MLYFGILVLALFIFFVWYFYLKPNELKPQQNFEQEIIKNQEVFKDLKVRHVFTHISKVEYVDLNWEFERILKVVLESKYSRFPVISESIDSPEGTLLAKDFLKAVIQGQEFSIKDLCIRPVFIHLDQTLSKALKKMLRTRTHLFFVIDDYGCVDGIITLEDVLEKLVGEIYDESDKQEISIVETPAGEIVLPVDTPVGDVFVKLDLDVGEDIEPVTILGWVKERLGRDLKPGEAVEIQLGDGDIPFVNPLRLSITLSERQDTLVIKKV